MDNSVPLKDVFLSRITTEESISVLSNILFTEWKLLVAGAAHLAG